MKLQVIENAFLDIEVRPKILILGVISQLLELFGKMFSKKGLHDALVNEKMIFSPKPGERCGQGMEGGQLGRKGRGGIKKVGSSFYIYLYAERVYLIYI